MTGRRYRIDRVRALLPKAFKTDAGFLRAPMTAVAGVGVQIYHDSRGEEVRELRLPEEVFDPASMDSLRGVPVALLHPTQHGNRITARNARALQHGSADNPQRIDGATGQPRDELLAADVTVTSETAIGQIESGRVPELSMGYTAVLVPIEGGTYLNPGHPFDGTKADFLQTEIRHNHVALEPAGRANEGRPDRPVRIRLDAAGDAYDPSDEASEGDSMEMKKMTHDGAEFEVPKSFADAFDGLKKKLADAEAQIENFRKSQKGDSTATAQLIAEEKVKTAEEARRADKAEGRVAGLEQKVSDLEAAAEKAKADSTTESAEIFAHRVDLVSKHEVPAAEVVKMDAKGVLTALAGKLLPGKDLAGKSEDWISAALEISREIPRADGASQLADAVTKAGAKSDNAPGSRLAAAFKAQDKRLMGLAPGKEG